jgi:hypothetical protein
MKILLKQQEVGFVLRFPAIRHCEELFLRRGNPEEISPIALTYNERKLDLSSTRKHDLRMRDFAFWIMFGVGR